MECLNNILVVSKLTIFLPFQDSTCTVGEICLKCWQTISQFSQFCEKIRGIHQNLIEVSSAGILKIEEHDLTTEVLEDEIEEYIPMGEIEEKDVAMLSIESDLGDEGDTFVRRGKHSTARWLELKVKCRV